MYLFDGAFQPNSVQCMVTLIIFNHREKWFGIYFSWMSRCLNKKISTNKLELTDTEVVSHTLKLPLEIIIFRKPSPMNGSNFLENYEQLLTNAPTKCLTMCKTIMYNWYYCIRSLLSAFEFVLIQRYYV